MISFLNVLNTPLKLIGGGASLVSGISAGALSGIGLASVPSLSEEGRKVVPPGMENLNFLAGWDNSEVLGDLRLEEDQTYWLVAFDKDLCGSLKNESSTPISFYDAHVKYYSLADGKIKCFTRNK